MSSNVFYESIFVQMIVTLPLFLRAVVNESLCVTFDTILSSGQLDGAEVTLLLCLAFRFS